MRRVFAILFSLLSLSVYAAPEAEERGLRALNLSHGLSDLLVNVIYRSADGYLWFGTELGVDRFDGYRIKRFPINSDDIRSKRVFAITESGNGTIYVGSNQGLYVLHPNHSELERIDAKTIDFAVRAITADAGGTLYIGSEHGLYIYNEKTGDMRPRLLVNDSDSPENAVVSLYLDSKSHILWLLTRHNLWEFSMPTDVLTRYPLPSQSDARQMLMHNGILYIGTDGDGVLPFNSGTLSFEPPVEVGNGIVTSLAAGSRGLLVISTDGEGISLYSPAQKREVERITKLDDSRLRLRSNSVYSTLVDDRGLMWIGYYQSGVDYTPHRSGSLTPFPIPEYPEANTMTIRAFAVSHDQKYAVLGTHNGLVLANRQSGDVHVYTKPVIDSNLIFATIYYDGAFYIGTYHGGMYRVDPATGALSRFAAPELDGKSVFSLTEAPDGRLWVGASDGAYRFPKGSDKPDLTVTAANSPLPVGSVYEIFFDSSGRGWICTENGMALWHHDHLHLQNFPKGFLNKMKVRHIYETSDHTLYFIPDRGDIWRSNLAMTKFGKLDKSFCSRFSAAYFAIEDNDGWLWIGTDNGLFRYHPDGEYNVLNNLMGSQPASFTLASPIKAPDGDIWFGTTSGLQHLNYALLKAEAEQDLNTPILVTDILSNGVEISDRMKSEDGVIKIALAPEQNDISLRLSDFRYNLPEAFELEVWFEGKDEGWRKIDGRLDLHYYDLRSGTHTLRVREPGKPQSEVRIEIEKARAVNWLMILLLLLVILLAGGAWGYTVLRRRHRDALRRLEEELGAVAAGGASATPYAPERRAAYTTTRLSDEECRRLLRKLEGVMKGSKPYTNPDLKSKDLAEMIGTSAHALSFLFNQYLHKSYYDYVNEYRVEEFKELVKVADLNKYTLTTLAERCGFSSRASFFRHFKALTGITPAEYLKR